MRPPAARFAAAAMFVLSFVAALAALAPASLIAMAIERASGGRLTLAAADGRLWAGSGTVSATGDPARVSIAWTLSPWRLMRAELAGNVVVGSAEPTAFVITSARMHLGRLDVSVPAALVACAAGNYAGLALGGTVRLQAPHVRLDNGAGEARFDLDWVHASTGLVDVAPLGSYRARIEWRPQQARLDLRSGEGPLLLAGNGRWSEGRAVLALDARVAGERGDTLRAWLRTLTRERADGSFRFDWPPSRPGQRGPRS